MITKDGTVLNYVIKGKNLQEKAKFRIVIDKKD
jgi:hypothetical protein